jgi:DNA-binding response OmpR family regulator
MTAAAEAICPICGYDLHDDQPIIWAGFDMVPYGRVLFHGAEIKLTGGQSAVLWSLLKAHGRPLTRVVIAERIGCESDNPGNLVDVHICNIRRALAPHGEVPIRSRRSVGVYIDEAMAG